MTQADLAMVVGAAGQDGRILCEKLSQQGVSVVGLVKPNDSACQRRQELESRFACQIVEADLRRPGAIRESVAHYRPQKIFYLAAVHHASEAGPPSPAYWRQMVAVNFDAVEELARTIVDHAIECSVVYASSSQVWTPSQPRQIVNEAVRASPATFYGHTKTWATTLLRQYRHQFGLKASVAALFNHESSLRAPTFVSRKIAIAAARAARGDTEPLRLANIGATTDWSAAHDIVEGLALMANAELPDDYIIASGRSHSIKDLLSAAYSYVGLDWKQFVIAERDEDTPSLVGDATKISATLRWRPSRSFEEMVTDMVEADLKQPRQA